MLCSRCRRTLLAKIRYSSVRNTSTTSSHSFKNQFPFPSHPRPTPHQIFHLPRGASQEAVKSRYYDLVRIHHPDSPCNNPSLNHTQRHERFRAITTAYEALRRSSSTPGSFTSTFGPSDEMDAIRAELERRKRMFGHRHNRHAEYANMDKNRFDWNSNPDTRWKDQLIVAFGVTILLIGLAPSLFLYPFKYESRHREAMRNLARAKKEAAEHAEMRRQRIKERVGEITREREGG